MKLAFRYFWYFWYRMVLDGIGWYWMGGGTGWYWMALDGTGWHWMVLDGCFLMALFGELIIHGFMAHGSMLMAHGQWGPARPSWAMSHER